MLKDFLFVLLLAPILSHANETLCEIPKNISPDQEVSLPVDCTLQKLQLDKKKFSIVPHKQPPSEVDNGHRLIGLNQDGLILNVTADGMVYWVMKTEPWKGSSTAQPFASLMKEQFAKTPTHKKSKEKAK